jgi:hypothetical protein
MDCEKVERCEPEGAARSWANRSVHELRLVTAHLYGIEKMKCFVLLELQN